MTSSASSSGSADRRTGRSVLIVDDEAPVRGVVRCMLEDLGFDVLTAAEGGEAIEACRQHAGALSGVLLDLTMPGMSPDVLLRALREIAPDLPVIVASGWSEEDVRARYDQLDCAGYLRKPFGPQHLQEVLQRVIDT